MRVESNSQILGWVHNTRISEIRNTYHYDKGSDVTTVEKRSETFSVYDVSGKEEVLPVKGTNVDIQL
jgi:RNase P/RNase MRP subunit p29